jgi:hypothetical protein
MRLRNQLRSLRTFERQGEAMPTPVFPELLLTNYIRSIWEARGAGSERAVEVGTGPVGSPRGKVGK